MTVAMVKDEWVRAAMTDDSVVVELLVRLKQLKQTQTQTQVGKSAVAALRWGVRQPRSRTLRCDAVSLRSKGDSANAMMRASPTTPLSWSGGGDGASPSATADEETSRHQTSAVRSKSIAANETTSNTTKRLRKKKTFAELKEEESLLLKERINLKKELETLRATFKEEIARNKNLKRMKLDLGIDSARNWSVTSNEPEKAISTQVDNRVASSVEYTLSTFPSHSTVIDLPRPESCEGDKAVPAHNSPCWLPDLNMMPLEDDSGSETIYGMSQRKHGHLSSQTTWPSERCL